MAHDRPGVGRNLHEHPALGISCFLAPGNRLDADDRHHTQAHVRFSSGAEGCPAGDLTVALLARSAWHAVGAQLGTFYIWVNKPFSTGTVTLASGDPTVPPVVDLALLADARDLARMRAAFRATAAVALDPGFDGVRGEVFPTIYSDRVRRVSRPGRWNALQARVLAAVLDRAGPARPALIRRLIAPVGLEAVLADDAALDAYIAGAVVGVWHPTGTCRMGRADDPAAVTDGAGRVHGVPGLRVGDASLMPSQVCANTNLPVMMIAERIAEAMRG